MNPEKLKSPIFYLAIILYSTYIFGIIFPDSWWGTHFIAFLPVIPRYIILVLAGALIIAGRFHSFNTGILSKILEKIRAIRIPWLLVPIAGVLMAFMFYEFPIYKDYYGDAFVVLDSLEVTVKEVQPEFKSEVSSFNFRPEHGRVFMLGLFNYASWFSGWKLGTVFKVVGIVFGFVWVIIWLLYIKKHIHHRGWQIIMVISGLTPPCIGVFFGHNEVYAPIYVFILLFLMMLTQYIRTSRGLYLIISVILLLCLIRMHPLSLLLIPSLLIALVSWIRTMISGRGLEIKWKHIFYGLIIPIFIAGAVFYFFIQEDYKDPRVLKFTSAQDRLFLPLISPPEPYDRYNLLSFNHFFDYINVILFWSTPLLLLTLVFVFYLRKKINWENLSLIITALPILFYGSFLFVFNPLLSMPMDWDLFALLVPILLIFLSVVISQIEHLKLPVKSIAMYVLAFTLLNVPFVYINSVQELYANRLVSVGVRVFKTYYEWSGKQLDFAYYLLKDDPENQMAVQQEVLKKLRPYAVDNNDEHYGHLVSVYGASFTRQGKYNRALTAFRRARDYAPEHKVNLLRLLEAEFVTRRYEDAFGTALDLLELKYPREKKAMRMVVHCALEAEMYRDAYRFAEIYNRKWPGDSTIYHVEHDIDNNNNPEQLKYRFSRNR